MSRKKKERGKEYLDGWHEDRPKKKEKHGRMRRRQEGRKADRDWRAADLLRVFPPWVEGLAGPVLAVCRLAGSIVTLSREEEQQEGQG